MAIFEKLEENSNGSKRVILFVVIFCVAISLMSVIVAAIAIAKTSKSGKDTPQKIVVEYPSSSAQQTDEDQDGQTRKTRSLLAYPSGAAGKAYTSDGKRIWTVASGHDYGAHDYMDDEGYISGFNRDLINEVCKAVGMDCRVVWQPYTKCWDSQVGQHSQGGIGLLSGWYDACAGWYKTIGRIHVFQFSEPYLEPAIAFFFIKKGRSFSYQNLNRRKIGFLDGWASDEKCMYRMSKDKGLTYSIPTPAEAKKYIIHFQTTDAMRDAIVKGEIEAGWAGLQDMEHYLQEGQIEQFKGISYKCMLAGNAMMTRKDSDFNRYWNEGFQKIVASGKFKDLCTKAGEDHKTRGLVRCVN